MTNRNHVTYRLIPQSPSPDVRFEFPGFDGFVIPYVQIAQSVTAMVVRLVFLFLFVLNRYTRGQISSMEESFAETQKHQRASNSL